MLLPTLYRIFGFLLVLRWFRHTAIASWSTGAKVRASQGDFYVNQVDESVNMQQKGKMELVE